MTSRIYAACLASYNAGKLHGNWINANQSAEEIQSEIVAMLAASPEQGAEEWAVHDYEGFGDAFSLWYSTQDAEHFEIDELEEKFLEQWQGVHDSKEAFADYLLDSTGQLQEMSEVAQRYFDFEAFARDLELSGVILLFAPMGKFMRFRVTRPIVTKATFCFKNVAFGAII